MFEAGESLGGRVASVRDPETGAPVDNCTHVLLGCCSEAQRFLNRIGSLQQVEFHDKLNMVGRGRLTIRSSPLPAPLHLLPSILGSSYLSRRQKGNLAEVLCRVLIRKPLESQSAASYLKARGCWQGLLDDLVDPVIVSALNEPAPEASAKYARMALVEALLKSRRGYRLGVPATPHAELIHGAALRWLEEHGCKVRLKCRVRRVVMSDGMARSVELASGETEKADVVVTAVPPMALEKMGLGCGGGASLRWRPIISARLFYQGRTPQFEPACVVGEPFGWVFSKHTDPGCVEAVASAAESIWRVEKADLLALAYRAAAAVEPMLGCIPLARGIVNRMRTATFATLDCDAHRPQAAGSTANLFLAGDWTATGWPATIEGSVRSGLAAARESSCQ